MTTYIILAVVLLLVIGFVIVKQRKGGLTSRHEIQTMVRAARVHQEASQYAEAEAGYQQALKLAKDSEGDKSKVYAGVLANLALLHHEFENYEKAEPMYSEAILTLKDIDENSQEADWVLRNFASMYQCQGKHMASAELLRAAGLVRSLDEIVYDIAEHQKEEHYQELYEALPGSMLFVPVDASTLPQIPEGGYQVAENDSIEMQFIDGPGGKKFVSGATAVDHLSVQQGSVKMEAIAIMIMMLEVPEAEGFMLQSKTSFIGFERDWVKAMVEQLGEAG